MPSQGSNNGRALSRLSPGGARNFADTLRTERAAVLLLLASTVIALVWANSPWQAGYRELSDFEFGPAAIGLHLSVAEWATDGLLAIFFFVVGVELKREFVEGELRRPSTAAVPITAAVFGMAGPALVYTAVNLASPNGSLEGWAIPVATDIAFAVAVLAAFGSRLPAALRAFLLTLAVVDDLLGIIVIAVFYTDQISMGWLGASALAIVAFGVIVRTRFASIWLLLPIAIAAWTFMHSSGIHATIAGVALGFMVPALTPKTGGMSLAERFEHLWRPLSAGLAVPVFALFAAGVSLDPAALVSAAADPAAQGVALGLVVGKPLGILVGTALIVWISRTPLAGNLRWWDIVAVSVVGGIGFTVSLLIAELSFDSAVRLENVKAAVLIGSFLAAAIGAVLLTLRSRLRTGAEDE